MGMERSMMGRSRSLIKFRTTEISGEPCRRPNQILSDIALSIMGREYNHKCDYIHYAADYDTEEKKKFYFLVDWGASLQNRNEGQDDIHLKTYEVKYQDGECSFKAINIPANSFVSRRPWGGGELEWNYRAKMDIMDAASEYVNSRRT
ncbi:hypothetical protein TWF225_006963 [Orbilia oligospora]|nr:hypothetical protein TWF225_006963 [Orbilia oligospora]KAF3264171.1 hypothetical protein TWF217_003323 [Orbilia oligospora]KAF3296077.1 hypothetical protein TWF132_011546 [Orbilia oligospora]